MTSPKPAASSSPNPKPSPEPPVVVELTREEAAQKAGALEGAASSASMGYPNTPEGYERLCEFLLETASLLRVALSSTAEPDPDA